MFCAYWRFNLGVPRYVRENREYAVHKWPQQQMCRGHRNGLVPSSLRRLVWAQSLWATYGTQQACLTGSTVFQPSPGLFIWRINFAPSQTNRGSDSHLMMDSLLDTPLNDVWKRVSKVPWGCLSMTIRLQLKFSFTKAYDTVRITIAYTFGVARTNRRPTAPSKYSSRFQGLFCNIRDRGIVPENTLPFFVFLPALSYFIYIFHQWWTAQ